MEDKFYKPFSPLDYLFDADIVVCRSEELEMGRRKRQVPGYESLALHNAGQERSGLIQHLT